VAGLPDLGEPVVIDVACGSGDLLVRLRARYPRARLTGVDLTAPMLEIARRRLAGADVALVQADMARLPAADGSVDILTGGYALRNAPDLDAFLAEVRRVLKPGGVAAFLDFARPDSPARARVHQALLAFWGGVWGRLLHGDANVYGYIAASLARHPPTAELAHRFAAHGLAVQARAFPLFGIMDLIHAVRPR
jgi:demethylmenaquinone methyltransferase/2-methoxy-6-polyprenyl-1,4-benzoquinol methylase